MKLIGFGNKIFEPLVFIERRVLYLYVFFGRYVRITDDQFIYFLLCFRQYIL